MSGNAQVRAMNALTESIGELLGELRAEMSTELRDLREESRARRQALLRMIDRLGPSPGGATA